MLKKGKTAIVTGAGRGIGFEIIKKLSMEGYSCIGLDIHVDEDSYQSLKDQEGIDYEIVDVTEPVQVKEAFKKIHSTYGGIDILVNNAAITNNISQIMKMDIEKWNKEIDVNLNGAFHCIKYALPHMIPNKWGRIVNISSMAATGGIDRQSSYAASKAGLLGLTKNVTLEYAEHGITCNAILPGLIQTEAVGKMPDIIKNEALRVIPSNRLGNMDEVAELVSFLVSEHASYINGVEIPIDGGGHCNPISLARTKI
ncbi:SDR family NAD(P)-dependent oxidoreductase [Oceanobacillus salinisoli]|uniref:SDR family NAD(P)-dependent oxidoreductase n=1 Tax=Oceanobacillus salinisoli TaxID=2678611 RepID=UPI0012E16F2C|nr:SDR family NAD(P)-dependent oxidoreductase [Oceanobacillus salinisoli]